MRPTVCPFCGVATSVPHETQERCIRALQEEIARIREIVQRPELHELDVQDSRREHPNA